MRLGSGRDQLEFVADRFPQTSCVVAHDGQAAAPFRPVERKGGDNRMPERFDSPSHPRDIGGAVVLVGQEMKRRPVVPDVEGRLVGTPRRHIRDHPLHRSRPLAETILRGLERSLRNVEYSDVPKASVDQGVDKT